ncbi:DUF664 domain-containing protein [Streptomyces sp. NPDC059352]|uniref:mycothiol transferase n=1 Tax=Streptomyces sp. NPDC059352 TaxID=3346810 RepID=UPI0036AA7FF6
MTEHTEPAGFTVVRSGSGWVCFKVEGRTPGVASGTSVLGLVKHLTVAEVHWFAWAFEGADIEHPDFGMGAKGVQNHSEETTAEPEVA